MKRSLATVALTCVLSVSAMAGDMPTCGIMAEEPTTESGNVPSTDSEAPTEYDLFAFVLSVLSMS